MNVSACSTDHRLSRRSPHHPQFTFKVIFKKSEDCTQPINIEIKHAHDGEDVFHTLRT